MKIAVASGKGGTGKTTVATCLAWTARRRNRDVLYLDCDVEEPNAHLFLEPDFETGEDVNVFIPQVDETRCTLCGKCAAVCAYHAIAVLGKKTLVFPQLCHGCGSCSLICPENAIQEIPNRIGVIEAGTARRGISFARGVLDVGEPMALPVIRQLKKWQLPKPGQTVIQDAPPGTSCPVVETARRSDFILLVTEPTPFGLHDLRLAAEVADELSIPAGVIINRVGIGDSAVEEFCVNRHLPILMRIPYERRIAEGVAQGQTLVDIDPGYIRLFQEVFAAIGRMVKQT